MKTIDINEFKTVCKGSRLLALELFKQNNVKITKVKLINPKAIGKSVVYYNDKDEQVGFLNAFTKLQLVIPSTSPIYS